MMKRHRAQYRRSTMWTLRDIRAHTGLDQDEVAHMTDQAGFPKPSVGSLLNGKWRSDEVKAWMVDQSWPDIKHTR